MNELGEDLDRALRTVTFSEAPIERVKRDGRRIRTRRRVTLLAGVLAVAAAAAGYPALAETAPRPAPAAGHTTHHDVITDMPPGRGTDKTGVIAAGPIGGARWQVTVRGPGAATRARSLLQVTAFPGRGTCNDLQAIAAAAAAEPAVFTGISEGTTVDRPGLQDVTYFIVTFTDGQQLKLIPVRPTDTATSRGSPRSMSIRSQRRRPPRRPVQRQRADGHRGPVRPAGRCRSSTSG